MSHSRLSQLAAKPAHEATPGRLRPTACLRWALCVFSLSFGLCWLLRLENPPLTADSFVYLSGAKSFAEGHGYRMEWHEGKPLIGLYPPANSYWLSLFWGKGELFRDASVRLNLSMCLVGACVDALIFLFFVRGGLPVWMSLCWTGVWATSPLWIQWLFFYMSDPGFLAWVLVAMILLMEGELGSGSGLRLAGVGTAVAMSMSWRAAGLGLFVGLFAICWHFRLRWRAMACLLAPAALGYLGTRIWMGASKASGYLENYIAFIGDAGGWLGLLWEKGDELLSWMSGRWFFEAVFPMVSRSTVVLQRYSDLLRWASSGVMALGFLMGLRRAWVGWRTSEGQGRKAVLVLLAAYSCLVFAAPNPGWFAHRYLYPVWIFGALWFGRGLLRSGEETERQGTRSSRSLVVWVSLAACGFNLVASIRNRNVWNQPAWSSDLASAARRIEQESRGTRPKVAVSINRVPAIELAERLDGGLVEPYVGGSRSRFSPIFLTHGQQGYPKADFHLTVDAPPFHVPEGLLVPVHWSEHPEPGLRLFRIDSGVEAEWRKTNALPPVPR